MDKSTVKWYDYKLSLPDLHNQDFWANRASYYIKEDGLEELSRKKRLQYLFTLLILITIPCYLLGIVLLRLDRGPQPGMQTPTGAATITQIPVITLTPYLTRTASITPTETSTLQPTNTPIPSVTPTATLPPTETAIPIPTEEPTATAEVPPEDGQDSIVIPSAGDPNPNPIP